MSSYIRRLVGLVKVYEKNDTIYVEGISTEPIANAFTRTWGTSRISNNIFTSISGSSFSFNRFFAPDLVYGLETILNGEHKNLNRRMISKTIDLIYENTWMSKSKEVPKKILNWSKISNLVYKPLQHQLDFANNYEEKTQRFMLNGYLLAADPGAGKAQPLDSMIKVPGGWVKMGDIRAGQSITCHDGSTASVTGVFPQGLNKVVKITFNDGRATKCDIEHLWKIQYRNQDKVNWDRIISTRELIELHSKPIYKNNLYIPLCKSEQIRDFDIPLDSYMLGLLLYNCIITKDGIRINTLDSDISKYLEDNIPKCFKIKYYSKYYYKFSSSMMNINLDNNNIPEIYLNASTSQRLSLLQGLLDSNSDIDQFGNILFCSDNEQLIKQVQYLVRSLGGIAKYDRRLFKYHLYIQYKSPNELFRLKQISFDDDVNNINHLDLRIDKIELLEPEETQCISISHPDQLYITDDFIVTHNTYTGLMMGELLETDVNIFIVPKNSIDVVWRSSFEDLYKKHNSYWVSSSKDKLKKGFRNYAFHYESLSDAIDFFKRYPFKNPMIWLDESHNLNELSSTRTKLFIELNNVVSSKHVIWASGTPIKAMGKEVIPLLKSIDPLFDKDAEERFIQIFGKSASRALDILNARIGRIMHRTDKSQFRNSKPITNELNITIPNGQDYTLEQVRVKMTAFIIERMDYYQKNMPGFVKKYEEALRYHEKTLKTKEQKDKYNQYVKYVSTIRKGYTQRLHGELAVFCNRYESEYIIPSLPHHLRDDFKETKTIVKYYKLKVRGEALGRVLGKMREQCAIDMVRYVNLPSIIDSAKKKTIIFTTFVGAVLECQKYLTEEGYKPLVVYGETNKDLFSIVKQFKEDDNINPLIATYASLSTAVPLTMANTCIMLNMPFREYIYKQAISRVDRIGQDTDVYLYNVYLETDGKPNLSTRSNDILEWCKQQVELILGKSPEYEEEISGESFDDYFYIKTRTDQSFLGRWINR